MKICSNFSYTVSQPLGLMSILLSTIPLGFLQSLRMFLGCCDVLCSGEHVMIKNDWQTRFGRIVLKLMSSLLHKGPNPY